MGLKGLDDIFERLAPRYAPQREAELAAEILAQVRQRNYVPDGATAEYARALLAAFKRHLGLEAAEPRDQGLQIQVLGPGCAGCHQLVHNVIEALAQLGLKGQVELVTDPLEIGAQRVQGQPALVINGQVRAVGTSPSPAQIIRWLQEMAPAPPGTGA